MGRCKVVPGRPCLATVANCIALWMRSGVSLTYGANYYQYKFTLSRWEKSRVRSLVKGCPEGKIK